MTSSHDTGAGDRPPGGRLERPPGDRYLDRTPPSSGDAGGRTPGTARATLLGGAVALAGGVVLAALGVLDLAAGLLAAAIALGWATGLAVRWAAATPAGSGLTAGRRAALAGVLAMVGVVAGIVLLWAWSRLQGGVLGPLDYLGERFGPLPIGMLGLAAIAAALRAR